MPLDPVQVEYTLRWLTKANDDLRAAQALIHIEPPLFDEIAFHCQQAIEKAEKGFLFWHKQPFQKTHDLYLLGLSCCEIDSSLSDIIKPTAKLTEYAVEYRYPSSAIHPSRNEIGEMIYLAKTVLTEISNRLQLHPSFPNQTEQGT
jgi:HEPN domain-containing protein